MRRGSLGDSRFNPPPASSARELPLASTSISSRFQSTPASSARGTRTHATNMGALVFQSTPRLIGEGNGRSLRLPDSTSVFQSTPASSARGIRNGDQTAEHVRVLIHPPPHRRGEHVLAGSIFANNSFQSTPRLIGEGNWSVTCDLTWSGVQSTPRLIGEGNASGDQTAEHVRVHPPPASSARGTFDFLEHLDRFVVSNPPPASSARGTRGVGLPRETIGFNPPPASSARGRIYGWSRALP